MQETDSAEEEDYTNPWYYTNEKENEPFLLPSTMINSSYWTVLLPEKNPTCAMYMPAALVMRETANNQPTPEPTVFFMRDGREPSCQSVHCQEVRPSMIVVVGVAVVVMGLSCAKDEKDSHPSRNSS